MTSREEKYSDAREEIENNIKKDYYKKIFILLVKLTISIVVIFSLLFFYTKYVSTSGLIIKEKRITSNKLGNNFEGIKIIHFSDLYYGSTVFIDDVDEIVKKINIRKPDLVLFNGNLLSNNYKISSDEQQKLIKKLSSIESNIGKYAILSDNDTEESKAILKQSGFIFLEDSSEFIYDNDNNPIVLSFFNKDINKKYEYYNNDENKNIYNITLLENPDDIDKIVDKYNIDLALSGKSLNGQICLYSDLCFVKYDGAKKYYKEYYKVNNTKLFISSGIGTDKIGFRFMARPSINFFRLSFK